VCGSWIIQKLTAFSERVLRRVAENLQRKLIFFETDNVASTVATDPCLVPGLHGPLVLAGEGRSSAERDRVMKMSSDESFTSTSSHEDLSSGHIGDLVKVRNG